MSISSGRIEDGVLRVIRQGRENRGEFRSL